MKEKLSTDNEHKCCSRLELALKEQTLRISPLGIDYAERTFYNLLEFSTAYLQPLLQGIESLFDLLEGATPLSQEGQAIRGTHKFRTDFIANVLHA